MTGPLILVGSHSECLRDGYRYRAPHVRLRLACGHWSQRLDGPEALPPNPMQAVYCQDCLGFRYLDVLLQTLFLNEEGIPAAMESGPDESL